MSRPDTPILNRLAQANDGRSAITGEHSGSGYLGSKRMEAPIIYRTPAYKTLPRCPERDTKDHYAFRTGIASYRYFPKSVVDNS